MRLTSTDYSSLTAIAAGTALAVGVSIWFITGAPEPVDAVPVTTEDVVQIEPEVHHDVERTRRILVRSAEEPHGGEPALTLEAGIDGVEGAPLIFVDGVRVIAMPSLSPDEIDRIEVLKGDAAVWRYGTSASAGVIEIHTKSASAQNPGR